MLSLWYSQIYSDGLDEKVRFPKKRYRMLYEALQSQPLIRFVEPQVIRREDLIRAHCPAYVDRFLSGSLHEKEIRQIGLRPWTAQMIQRTLVLTGGTLAATKHAWEHQIGGNLGGGTHHAYFDHGSGYCIFNDLAIAARWLQTQGIKRIMIIDLDVHQGDGTASIFADDEAIFTLSVHCGANFPFRKQKSDKDIVLERGTQDDEYLRALHCIPQLLDFFQPEFAFFQAGVDPLEADHLGKLSLTRAGLQKRNRMVFESLSKRNIPVVVTMGGGYAQPLSYSIDAHSDLYIQASHFSHPCFF